MAKKSKKLESSDSESDKAETGTKNKKSNDLVPENANNDDDGSEEEASKDEAEEETPTEDLVDVD